MFVCVDVCVDVCVGVGVCVHRCALVWACVCVRPISRDDVSCFDMHEVLLILVMAALFDDHLKLSPLFCAVRILPNDISICN